MHMKHKDFLGQEFKLGDSVIIMLPNYRVLTRSVVIQFTPQQVRVEYQYQGYTRTYLCRPCDVVLLLTCQSICYSLIV